MPEHGLFVNTLLLHEHCQKIRNEEYIARQLADLINQIHINASSEGDLRFGELSQQAERIVSFFHGMADTLEKSSDDFSRASMKIRNMLEGHRNF